MQQVFARVLLMTIAVPFFLHAQFTEKDAIRDFRIVRQTGNRVTVSVDYTITSKRDFPVQVGGTLLRRGKPIGGFAPGVLRGGQSGQTEFTIILDPDEDRSDQIEIYLVEPGTKPFVTRRFRLDREWSAVTSYEQAPAYTDAGEGNAFAGRILDYRVVRNRKNRYTLSVRYEVRTSKTLRMHVSGRLLKDGQPVGAYQPSSIRHGGEGTVDVDVVMPEGGRDAYDAIEFTIHVGIDKPFVRRVFPLPHGL